MNSLKTMAIAALMVAGLYTVYFILNRPPDTSSSTEMMQDLKEMGAGGIPNVDISLSNTEISPNGLNEISAEEALASTGSPNYGNSTGNTYGASNAVNPASTANSIGVPAPTAAPMGDQFNPNNNTATDTNFQEPQTNYPHYTGTNPTGNPEAVPANSDTNWQDQINQVNQQLSEHRLAEAHLGLSRTYADPNTTPEKKKQIEPLLDQLAGTVIYSREHLLEKPYKVGPNDTLKSISGRYNVPEGLLAKINGLAPNVPLQPGQELKVVQGPFSATVDLSDHILTLNTADGRYAGRFPIGIGPGASNLTRTSVYMVTDKTGDNPTLINAGLGRRWIGLGGQFGLHGTNNPDTIGTSNGNGAISLGNRDVEDLFDILSIGSKVTVQP